jgi:hypothetical protein
MRRKNMFKKKDIIIIIIILISTIALAFLPSLISNLNSNIEEEIKEDIAITTTKNKNTIEIKIEGEIKEDQIIITVAYGSSYGYILSKVRVYFNSYSNPDKDLGKRYYEDTTIFIESLDNECFIEEEIDLDIGKIKISTASKDELMMLYGIGEKRADKIMEYRKTNEIDSWDTLKKILGVSYEVIEAIKEKAVS